MLRRPEGSDHFTMLMKMKMQFRQENQNHMAIHLPNLYSRQIVAVLFSLKISSMLLPDTFNKKNPKTIQSYKLNIYQYLPFMKSNVF